MLCVPFCGGGLVAKSCPALVTPWTVAHQAPLSMGFPSPQDWNELPFPSPGDLPDPGVELASPVFAGRFFTTELPGKLAPHITLDFHACVLLIDSSALFFTLQIASDFPFERWPDSTLFTCNA